MKKQETNTYEYNTHHFSSIKSKWAVMLAIRTQVNNIIKKRHSAGITQNESLMALKQIRQGNFSRAAIRDYMQLLLDANASLGSPLRFPQKLQEEFLPYISNTEKERLSTQMSRGEGQLTGKGLEVLGSSSFHGRPILKKPQKPEPVFSDEDEEDKDEDEDEDSKKKEEFKRRLRNMDRTGVEFQKFVLGSEGSAGEFPYDIGDLTIEEVSELGFDVIGEAQIRLNEEGELTCD